MLMHAIFLKLIGTSLVLGIACLFIGVYHEESKVAIPSWVAIGFGGSLIGLVISVLGLIWF